MNQTTEFLAEQNASYLAGKAIESILSGDLKEAQELLKREEKRIDKLPRVDATPAPINLVDSPRKRVQDLTDTAKVCEICVKQDHREDLPFDYRITIHDKGKCDSCGIDSQLTNLIKVRSDIESQKKPEKLPFGLANTTQD